MAAPRSAFVHDPRLFGRRVPAVRAAEVKSAPVGDDVRLFAMTFAAGFLFMSVFLG
jgi:hypothetical protein